MTSAPANVVPARTTPRSLSPLFSAEMGFRFAMTGVAVGLCYLSDWEWLRYLTSWLNIRLDALAGIALQRLSVDSVFWKGVVYHYANACTFADVWCGSVPLLWNVRRTIPENLFRLAIWGAGLFLLNGLRLCFSDILFSSGISWNIAHNVVSGFCYFAFWVAIMWYREKSVGKGRNADIPRSRRMVSLQF